MAHQSQDNETTSFCTFHFLDCFASKDTIAQRRISKYPSVKRETNVLDQQPHLVEPMTLRVYEDLPATPKITEPSQLTQWSRNLASRASSRASRISIKRRTTFKSLISKPQTLPEESSDMPFRRRREFTPLELSIYRDSQRLSDLPEMDRLSFTSLGELKQPPKALIRTQSEGLLRKEDKVIIDVPKRTASMFETGQIIFARPGTSHSVLSMSRPPSGYDALHSHPVSWTTLPGLPASRSQKPEHSVAVMTPMQEEFSPEATTVTVNGTALHFPKAVPSETARIASASSVTPDSQAPYPVINKGPSSSTPKSRRHSIRPASNNNNYQNHKRVSQWLQYRSQSSSTSTISSFSTTASFAEHRRKRSEFYKLGQQPQVPATTTAPPPKSLNFSKALPTPQHQRTDTESTAQTVDTSLLSSAFDEDSDRHSEDSTTTYSTTDIKSRTGTVKSVASPCGLRIINPGHNDVLLSPALKGEIVGQPTVYVSEINGSLPSPRVGLAF